MRVEKKAEAKEVVGGYHNKQLSSQKGDLPKKISWGGGESLAEMVQGESTEACGSRVKCHRTYGHRVSTVADTATVRELQAKEQVME